MKADGSNIQQLTNDRAIDARPAWSPDGGRLVFHSTRNFGSDGASENWHEFEIYVRDAKGSERKRLTVNDVFDAHPD